MGSNRLIGVGAIAAAILLAVAGRADDTPPVPSPATTVKSETASITDEDVELAIRRAVDFLWSQQLRDGRWISPDFERTFPNSLTALAAYTARAAGTPLSDHRLKLAVRQLLDRSEINTIYARSFILMLWCSLGTEHFGRLVEEDVRFLKVHQDARGGWGYGRLADVGPVKGWTDNSNSQLALLAAAEAARIGTKVSAGIWRRAERSWLDNINPDGGWGYPLSKDPQVAHFSRQSTGSMTTAGLASLSIIYDQLYLDAELAFNGRFVAKCGQDIEKTRPIRRAIDQAWQWLIDNYRTDAVPGLTKTNPDDPFNAYLTYYLFCLNRAGLASGRKRIGPHLWYEDIAEQLIRTQRDDGSWGNVYQTCFGVLALLSGRLPVLINKLAYGESDDWNTSRHDAANLTRWFSRRSDTPLTWQAVELGADLRDVYDAPILLITGHEKPPLTDEEQSQLRDFVHAGGTVLAVACCSQPDFTRGCMDLFSTLFPHFDSGPLPEDHLVWTMHDTVKPGDDCIGFSDGCRTSIFLLNNAACCAWSQNLIKREERRFSLGGNIIRYATWNRSLRGRLAPYIDVASAAPLRTLHTTRLIHQGDWWVDPDAMKHVSRTLSLHSGLGLTEHEPLHTADLKTTDAKALWLTGHEFEPLLPKEQGELRDFLGSGGTLIASARCGGESFDENFTRMATEMFGGDAWQRIGPRDPLMTGSFAPQLASSLHAVNYRPRYQANPPPRLDWPILYGVRDRDRWMVIYSPFDVSAGISRQNCLNCAGYIPRDAQAIVANIMLYVAQQEALAKQDTTVAPHEAD